MFLIKKYPTLLILPLLISNFFVLFLLISSPLNAQEISKTKTFRVLFYNVENLFDCIDDSLSDDKAFTPTGINKWTSSKYQSKLNHIYKVITAVGEGEMSSIIGLAEIENQHVLDDLINFTPLLKYKYQSIHFESPDNRGVDVAFLYLSKSFKPILYYPIRISFPFNKVLHTRDILYIKGILAEADTIHFFINHWPSRANGAKNTEDKRLYCASILRSKTDSLLKINPSSKIIIMGDFNDNPEDESIVTLVSEPSIMNQNSQLTNLSKFNGIGSIKYRGDWFLFDQLIVSDNLLKEKHRIYLRPDAFHIYSSDFLLSDDLRNFGKKPFRSFLGPLYINGFSDHLPIYFDISVISK